MIQKVKDSSKEPTWFGDFVGKLAGIIKKGEKVEAKVDIKTLTKLSITYAEKIGFIKSCYYLPSNGP